MVPMRARILEVAPLPEPPGEGEAPAEPTLDQPPSQEQVHGPDSRPDFGGSDWGGDGSVAPPAPRWRSPPRPKTALASVGFWHTIPPLGAWDDKKQIQ